MEVYISLLNKNVIQTLPKVLCRDLVKLNGWFLRTKYPTAFHATAKIGERDKFGVAKFPRSVTTKHSRRFNLLTFVEPRILEVFVPNSAVSFALSSAIVHIFFKDRFGGKLGLLGGVSCRISIEIPSLASMANFKTILQRSHLKGVPMWAVPKGVLFQNELVL